MNENDIDELFEDVYDSENYSDSLFQNVNESSEVEEFYKDQKGPLSNIFMKTYSVNQNKMSTTPGAFARPSHTHNSNCHHKTSSQNGAFYERHINSQTDDESVSSTEDTNLDYLEELFLEEKGLNS